MLIRNSYHQCAKNNQYAFNDSFDITTRLKHTIIAINGDSRDETIRYFVDNMMLQDSRALRKYINEITPDLEMTFSYEDSKGDVVEGVSIPMNINFLYPDARIQSSIHG